MAMAGNAHGIKPRPSANRFVVAFRGATARLGQVRKFRQTLSDLYALTDAELKSLGLSRDMIRPVAWQTAKAA